MDSEALLQQLTDAWTRLEVPTASRLEMVIRYSSPAAVAGLNTAVGLWKAAADAVLACESIKATLVSLIRALAPDDGSDGSVVTVASLPREAWEWLAGLLESRGSAIAASSDGDPAETSDGQQLLLFLTAAAQLRGELTNLTAMAAEQAARNPALAAASGLDKSGIVLEVGVEVRYALNCALDAAKIVFEATKDATITACRHVGMHALTGTTASASASGRPSASGAAGATYKGVDYAAFLEKTPLQPLIPLASAAATFGAPARPMQ